jgi:hypothetical protein
MAQYREWGGDAGMAALCFEAAGGLYGLAVGAAATSAGRETVSLAS